MASGHRSWPVGFRRRPDRFLRQADNIVDMEKDFLHVSDRKLRDLMAPLRDRFRLGRDTEDDRHWPLPSCAKSPRERSACGLIGSRSPAALALEAGCVAEMATGEGKTLVATMPAVLAGWRGRGCHVITANDYLAERDAELMMAIYRFCGLTVGCIDQGMASAETQAGLQRAHYLLHEQGSGRRFSPRPAAHRQSSGAAVGASLADDRRPWGSRSTGWSSAGWSAPSWMRPIPCSSMMP